MSVSGVDQISRSHGRLTNPGHMKGVKLTYSRQTYNSEWVLLKSDGNPLGHLLLHRLVSIHDRLLVDDDLCRVGFGSADTRCYRRRIRFHNDTVKRTGKHRSQFIAGEENTTLGCEK